MKISRDGWLPQLEPEGSAEGFLVRLGGAKRIVQQSSFPMQAVTMVNASISAWATSAGLRDLFWNDVRIFAGVVTAGLIAWMVAYFSVILPGEQAWGQGQSQRTERSPLKQDTEDIISRLDSLEMGRKTLATDGDGGSATVVPECGDCGRAGQSGEHKGEDVIQCPDCGHILFRNINT